MVLTKVTGVIYNRTFLISKHHWICGEVASQTHLTIQSLHPSTLFKSTWKDNDYGFKSEMISAAHVDDATIPVKLTTSPDEPTAQPRARVSRAVLGESPFVPLVEPAYQETCGRRRLCSYRREHVPLHLTAH